MPTHYSGTAKERLALNSFIKLNRAASSVNSRLIQRNTHPGLSVTQFSVLEVLHHLGAMCQSELGEKVLKSNANITMVIDNLEKHGLVKRERHPDDRRMFRISLTPAGEEKITAVLPGHVAAIVDEFSSLNPEEQDLLGELCRKLGKKQSP